MYLVPGNIFSSQNLVGVAVTKRWLGNWTPYGKGWQRNPPIYVGSCYIYYGAILIWNHTLPNQPHNKWPNFDWAKCDHGDVSGENTQVLKI
jgi:hypothetical protein